MPTPPPSGVTRSVADGGYALRADSQVTFTTRGGITMRRSVSPAEPADLTELTASLDERVGAVFTSGVEFPGRYTRWETGYRDPLLILQARGLELTVHPTGQRGELVRDALAEALVGRAEVEIARRDADLILRPSAAVQAPESEEERSRRPSTFTCLRTVLEVLGTDDDRHLGLYGAFSYDLLFTFEPIEQRHDRSLDPVPDFELHLPDRLLVHDRFTQEHVWIDYTFVREGRSTAELAADTVSRGPSVADPVPADAPAGTYAAIVDKAKERFAVGDLYEVVPSWPFHVRCPSPAQMFDRLCASNPAPYGFLMSLTGSHLVGASPEMYVRVTDRTVETCPISGTRSRGSDAMGDARQILDLLNSPKDEAELTMCTDVDRNDKSRVCEPGSVKVIGRRQIEMYSRLIHTVDHVVGTLLPGKDGLDAFLTHMWAVTITGAPKKWATQFIEDHEEAPRRWYGGAVGGLMLNGDVNTGLTLRTAEVRNQVAIVRAGATLLFDSDPADEEEETRLKASALLRVASGAGPAAPAAAAPTDDGARDAGAPLDVVVVDHEDSFTLSLASYFRQAGCEVVTVRSGTEEQVLAQRRPDLVVLSPGPGRPETFGMAALIKRLRADDIAVFGVCLGLQGILESHGAPLRQLAVPVHGKTSRVATVAGTLFAATGSIDCGRYHSLHVLSSEAPDGFDVTAEVDGIAMAAEHRTEPIWGVQFHPESIMSEGQSGGLAMIDRVVEAARAHRAARSS